MPGRIVGRTTDMDDKPGFTLTLQAREQHIRRSKATSNICTNQGLMVTAATIYLSLLGSAGLKQVALVSNNQTSSLLQQLTAIDGVTQTFSGNFFHEVAVTLDRPVAPVLDALAARDILGGLDLSAAYPDLGNTMLICATETKTEADLQLYASALADIMKQQLD
jgi:glycine dehydrogenase subunit 1